MQGNVNYQKELEKILERIQEAEVPPRLLLHSCCAPCSSYVLEYLSQYFAITVFYYNPNISPLSEYEKRVEEQRRLLEEMQLQNPVSFLQGRYEPEKFQACAKGLEQEPEGGRRCERCYQLRLRETAVLAKEKGFDYFATTLTISPLKSAQKINEIGLVLGNQTGVVYLASDFKKKDGYKRSLELSAEYRLYRQDHCGCEFSKRALV